MTWLAEGYQSIVGSLRLAVRDEGGFDDFNLTETGFWRSFAAIIILAPLYLYGHDLQVAIEAAESTATEGEAGPIPGPVGGGIAGTVGGWPIAMAVIARFIGLSAGYSRYITVYNWSSILVGAVQIVPVFLLCRAESSPNSVVCL